MIAICDELDMNDIHIVGEILKRFGNREPLEKVVARFVTARTMLNRGSTDDIDTAIRKLRGLLLSNGFSR